MSKSIREAVIVAYGRSAIGRAMKGALKDTHPVDYAAEVLCGVLNKVPQLSKEDIDDVMIGCSTPQGKMGCNMARLIVLRSGLPVSVPGQTINRFCSSGLQSIATAANAIMAGQAEVIIAGGVETMSRESMAFDEDFKNNWLVENDTNAYMLMGMTAENVAKKYNVPRERMDTFALESHQKAHAAQQSGKFVGEIIPVMATQEDGSSVPFAEDQGIRPNATLESLAGLQSPFMEDGNVTAGTSSQLSDGAAMVVLMSREKAEALGIRPIARFVGFAVAGVDPAYMGIGPVESIPKVMKQTGLSIADMDVIELNEAFASQALACMDVLGIDPKKVNPNGGAIALGHPLGGTGSILTCKALAELARTGGKYALITMCIGGGMGGAGIFEML